MPQLWTLMGGGWRGGKTWWMGGEIFRLMIDYPGIEGFVARYDYAKITEPTQVWDTLHQLIPDELIADEKKNPPAQIQLYNGSRVTAIGLKEYHAGAGVGFIAIDQAEEVPIPGPLGENILAQMVGRLSQVLPDGSTPHYRILLTCNPAPGWLEETFIRDAQEVGDRVYVKGDYCFVQALPEDNPHLDPQYIERNRSALSDEDFKRYIQGSWDAFIGQAITEWNHQIHIIDENLLPDWYADQWPVYRGIDYGLNNPNVCEFAARAPEREIVFVDEFTTIGETPRSNAMAIAEYSDGMNCAWAQCDPRFAQVKTRLGGDVGTAVSAHFNLIDEYRAAGIYVTPARESREERLSAWKTGLHIDPNRRHLITGERGAPLVYVSTKCKELIRSLPKMRYTQGKDDVEKTDDHWYDAGGFVLSRLINPKSKNSRQAAPYIGSIIPQDSRAGVLRVA